MFIYHLEGMHYDEIMCKSSVTRDGLLSVQYYMKDRHISSMSRVFFVMTGDTIDAIKTDDKDTVILPKLSKCRLRSGVVQSAEFRRLVVPSGVRLKLDEYALFGSSSLLEFVSLSRDVSYCNMWAPNTVKMRYL